MPIFFEIKKKEIFIFLIVLLSRIPFIFNSLGVDLDGWREVFSGKILSETGIYNVSRFPGYPFPEIVLSLFYQSSYWVINLLSVIFTAGSSLFLYKILEFFRIKNSVLLSIASSFIPAVFINSTVMIDYKWSLFFLLGSLYFCCIKRFYFQAFSLD